MPGIYNKNNLILRSFIKKYPYENIEMVLKKPKIVYNESTLDLPLSLLSDIRQYINPSSANSNTITKQEGKFTPDRDNAETIGTMKTAISVPTAIISKASKGVEVAKDIGINLPGALASGIGTASEIASAAGPALSALGATVSGISLGFDIANAKDAGKVTFDNAMNMADDGTGLVSGVVGMIPGVGSAIGMGLTAGEKVVTSIFKGGKAVLDERAKNIPGENWVDKKGKNHLKPAVWWNTFIGGAFPKWWSIDIGSKEWKQYWKEHKEQKKAEKAAAKEQKKQAKAERKEIWKHGTTKEKVKDFFFG